MTHFVLKSMTLFCFQRICIVIVFFSLPNYLQAFAKPVSSELFDSFKINQRDVPKDDQSTTNTKSLSGPKFDHVFADPSVIKVDDSHYYAYATQDKKHTVPVATSEDFSTWTYSDKDALPELPKWASQGQYKFIWAPEVTQFDSNLFIMYYTSPVASDHLRRCIGVAVSSSPVGPFRTPEQHTEPIVCPPDSVIAIDPASWVDPQDNSRYLLYGLREKIEGKKKVKNSIMLQQLSPDGLSKTKEDPQELINADNSAGSVIGSPSLIRVGDKYILLYSIYPWNTIEYTVSVATAKKLKGPWVKQHIQVIDTARLQSEHDKQNVAPGGADVLLGTDSIRDVDGDGKVIRIVFHAATDKEIEKRRLWTANVIVKDGQVRLNGDITGGAIE